jgi:F-type H+-transporting ATPase subunit gamma
MADARAAVHAQLASMEELKTLLGALRALAASRYREAQRILPGVRTYEEVVSRACARAMASLPAGAPSRRARPAPVTVLFGAEHGFVGAFDDRLLEAMVGRPGTLVVVGARACGHARERGLTIQAGFDAASSVAALSSAVVEVCEALTEDLLQGQATPVEVLFARRARDGRTTVERESILPPPGPGASGGAGLPPLSNLAPAALVDRLADEYLLARLTRAATESFAAENASRLEILANAQRHVDERIERLARTEHHLRQEEITAELLELLAGRGRGP